MAASNIDPLVETVKADDDVIDSALIWINGARARTEAAVSEALKLGATQAELQPLVDELALQKTKAQAVAEAIAANTPVAPTP